MANKDLITEIEIKHDRVRKLLDLKKLEDLTKRSRGTLKPR